MELSPDYFPDELRMDWCQARALRRDIDQEAETYRMTRLLQPEGLPSSENSRRRRCCPVLFSRGMVAARRGDHYWEIEVEYRPTGELFCVRWWAEWVERVRTDAGY
jgi:hypothetical protein